MLFIASENSCVLSSCILMSFRTRNVPQPYEYSRALMMVVLDVVVVVGIVVVVVGKVVLVDVVMMNVVVVIVVVVSLKNVVVMVWMETCGEGGDGTLERVVMMVMTLVVLMAEGVLVTQGQISCNVNIKAKT